MTPINVGHAASSFAYSPGGTYLATVMHTTHDFGSGSVLLIDLASWHERTLDLPPSLSGLFWSPDGAALFGLNYLGGAGEPSVEVWSYDVERAAARLVGEYDFGVRGAPMLSPRGAELYLFGFRAAECCGIRVEGEPFIAVIELATGELAAEIALPGVLVGQRFEQLVEGGETNVLRTPAVAMTPDGGTIFVAHADEDLVTVVDLEARQVARTFQPQAPASLGSRLGSWLLSHLARRAEAKGGLYAVKQAVVSGDGSRLYVTGWSGEMCEGRPFFPCVEHRPIGLQVIDTSGYELVAEFDDISDLIVSPDGRWLLGTGWSYDFRDEDADRAIEVGYGLQVIDAQALEVVAHYEPDIAIRHLAVTRDSHYAHIVTANPPTKSAEEQAACETDCQLLSVIALPGGELTATRVLPGAVSLVRPE